MILRGNAKMKTGIKVGEINIFICLSGYASILLVNDVVGEKIKLFGEIYLNILLF